MIMEHLYASIDFSYLSYTGNIYIYIEGKRFGI